MPRGVAKILKKKSLAIIVLLSISPFMFVVDNSTVKFSSFVSGLCSPSGHLFIFGVLQFSTCLGVDF